MEKRNSIFVLLIGLAFLAMTACAGGLSQLPPSPEKTYAQSLTAYNDAQEAYVAALMLQDEETKAQWKRDINPLLDLTDMALEAWWDAIGTNAEDDARYIYQDMWNKLFPLLFSMGIVGVEE